MRPLRFWGSVVAAALAGGCAGHPGSGGAPLVLSLGGDELAQARSVASRAGQSDVIYLGEQHDNPHHHIHQRQILEALLAQGARPALAFEMLDGSQQGAVERALETARTPAELDRDLRWRARGWPDFSMYWPLFDLARKERLPLIALDLDQAEARRIAHEGMGFLGERRATLTSLLSPDPKREERIARDIRDAHCGLLPESRLGQMVESWHARNVAMARRLGETADRSKPVVVIVGRGHQEAGGLPAQLQALRPGTRQLIVDMVEVPAGASAGDAVSEVAGDVVWLTPAVERPDPCESLRRGPR